MGTGWRHHLTVVQAADSIPSSPQPRLIGRYAVYREIASGGMASVWLARQRGDGGFSRVVAVKQLFPQFARDPEFVTMLRDEARLVARIRHPNVIPTLDVAGVDGELILVMEYVAGESLSKLLAATRARSEPVDPAIAVAIITDVLEGLHAAHQATNERGMPLVIVHRDVSPQNVIVGSDGVARVFDFGIAKAVGRLQQTTEAGQIKGKVVYMPPEQVFGETVDRRSDIWAASVVLWEMLSGRQLFADIADAIRFHGADDEIEAPNTSAEAAALAPVLRRGLARKPEDRFATAREMIVALERALPAAPPRRVAQWVQKHARETLRKRAAWVEELESDAAMASLAALRASAPPEANAAAGANNENVAPQVLLTPMTTAEPTKRSVTSRRVVAAGLVTIFGIAVLTEALVVRHAKARVEIDASPAGLATTAPEPIGSVAPPSGGASAEVAPQPSVSPSSTTRVNGKRAQPIAPRGSARVSSSAATATANPLDPESRK